MDRIGGPKTESPAKGVPLFDAAQLKRQTHGNPSLQVEVLALFMAEAERLMNQVEDAPDPQLRAERLRALIGLSRNTGASLIAQQARALETAIATENPDLSPLRSAISDTLAYLKRTGG
jgi:HPt (histidine-containing phosphotransfer) domain-containing protein